mmetsp:Transcript_25749/g.66604  ORF Transcript_25749/g.66604 Transcript_25749/m.66604 type:complete len:288 (+) Transcript_25749:457-1320(+)
MRRARVQLDELGDEVVLHVDGALEGELLVLHHEVSVVFGVALDGDAQRRHPLLAEQAVAHAECARNLRAQLSLLLGDDVLVRASLELELAQDRDRHRRQVELNQGELLTQLGRRGRLHLRHLGRVVLALPIVHDALGEAAALSEAAAHDAVDARADVRRATLAAEPAKRVEMRARLWEVLHIQLEDERPTQRLAAVRQAERDEGAPRLGDECAVRLERVVCVGLRWFRVHDLRAVESPRAHRVCVADVADRALAKHNAIGGVVPRSASERLLCRLKEKVVLRREERL